MAHQQPNFMPAGLVADSDLSAKQFYGVKMSTTANQISLCDTDGEVFIGVLQNKPSASGNAAEIMSVGISKMVAGETIAAGDLIGVDANGKAKKIEKTNTGADIGDYYGGIALIGGSANELVTVMIGTISGVVESA